MEIPSGSSDKTDDRSSEEFTRYEQEMLAEIPRNLSRTDLLAARTRGNPIGKSGNHSKEKITSNGTGR